MTKARVFGAIAVALLAGGAAIAFAAALFAFFRFSRVGTAIRACADNYTGALVIGLDVKEYDRHRQRPLTRTPMPMYWPGW